jgi:hypothetical protein
VPLKRTGDLVFLTDDSAQPRIDVPLTGQIESLCALTISPSAVDFGQVQIDDIATISVVVANTGTASCEIAGLTIAQGSDPQFSLGQGQAASFVLPPGGAQSISLAFHAVDPVVPHNRAGQLVLVSTDPNRATITIPLSADIDIGCALTISPSSLNFGNIMLNMRASASIMLGNTGGKACQVSGVGLDPSSDPGFTLASGQELGFAVAPGNSQTITLQFGAFDSTPPHQKSGILVLQTGNPNAPQALVPLSAYVNSVCVEASQWIYTVDVSGMFSRFDPTTLTFADIGMLACPTSASPNSMAVDQDAVAWVAYEDGNLFKVDTSTGQCEVTTFQPNQDGLTVFGMGFVFDPSTGVDTLYIAGGAFVSAASSTLATVSFPTLTVTPIGTVAAGSPELTGTGDGALWGFIPLSESTLGPATLLRLDTSSGAVLESHPYPSLSDSGAWAVKFWGGSFWIFLNSSVYRVPRDTPDVIQTVIANTGRLPITGAGVSTCAPLQ